MRGETSAESIPGFGRTFHFTLRFWPLAKRRYGNCSAAIAKMLINDYHEASRNCPREMIASQVAVVEAFASGQEGLARAVEAAAEARPFDTILVDRGCRPATASRSRRNSDTSTRLPQMIMMLPAGDLNPHFARMRELRISVKAFAALALCLRRNRLLKFKNDLRDYFWPRVDDANAAKRVARYRVGAALFEGGFETLRTTLSLAGVDGVMRLGATAYFDASVFLILGVFTYRGPSRGASLLALCFFAAEIVWRIEYHLPENDPVFVTIFAWLYILGVRGTFAWHSHLSRFAYQWIFPSGRCPVGVGMIWNREDFGHNFGHSRGFQ